MNKEKKAQPLAIVGIACRFPKADGLEAYWGNLKNGVDAITEIPATHWDPADYFNDDPKKPDMTYARRGGFLSPFEFNPMEFGMAPNNIEATDTSQLLGMVVARDALRDAGYGQDKAFDRARTSVILGVTGTLELVVPLGARLGHPIWRKAMREAGIDDAAAADAVERIGAAYPSWQENSFPGLLGNVVAGRIANFLDLGGTNCVVDAACASSLSAINLAGLELETGRADMVVAGGVDTFNDIFMYMCFSKTPALSPTGDAKPFDALGDGTILGEGLGMVVLKRLADAEKDGDRIYAVISGIGSSSDGKGTAIYEPNASGQVRALENAYKLSGISPDTVELVEAHGTGTKVGDATEASALTKVYRASGKEGTWCALGSVKSMIGHTKAAAGIAGLIKAVMSLKNKTLPPTIKVGQPSDKVAPGTTPFYVNTVRRPWLPREEHPRRASLSALGFGGSNFHCVVEEYGAEKYIADWDGATQLLAFSAKDASGIDASLGGFRSDLDWEKIRGAATAARASFDSAAGCRLLVVLERGSDIPALISQARTLLKKNAAVKSWNVPTGIYFGSGKPEGKLGVLFPGQGSQYTGMLRDLACQFPRVLETLADADKSFSGKGEVRLSDRIYPHPTFTASDADRDDAALRATQTAQPAIGAVSLGALRVLEDFGVRPEAAGGHSYGELTALCAAGRLSATELFTLSELRGRLMAEGKADLGSMLAVMAPIAQVEAAVKDGKFDLVLANKNAPSQSVLSGATDEIVRAEKELTAAGLRCKRLPVAAAFHSKLVSDARKPFEKELKGVPFKKAAFPVYANSTGEVYPDGPADSRALLAGQLAQPVEFVKEVENMYASGVRTFLEVGPGARLTSLVKAILEGRGFEAAALDSSSGKRSGIVDLARFLALIAAEGRPADLTKWDEGFRLQEESAKAAFTISLTGANYMAPRKAKPPRQSAPGVSAPNVNGSAGVIPSSTTDRTQEHLEALQRIQEQTANLHAKFLEGQETALKTIQHLIAREHGEALTAPSWVPGVSAPPAVIVAPENLKAPSGEVQKVLLEVVSEKTGYPAEMLNLDMGLDSDLGIDSIKRVEILSALQEKLPDAPAVRPEQLGTLRTLREIVVYLSAATPGEPPVTHPEASVTPASALDYGKVESVLLEVVSEKTGYPAEMLNLDMGLDSDLGIDSIKRVEILSALQEKLPDAPTVRPEQLGTLRTLREIVEYLASGERPLAAKETEEQDSAVAAVPAASLVRSVLELSEIPSARGAVAVPKGSAIRVTDDGAGLSALIAEALTQLGYDAQVLQAGASLPEKLGGLLLLAPREGGDVFVKEALFLLKKAAGALRKGTSFFATVTRGDGAFGMERPAGDFVLNALAGLVKTAAREWPEVSCKAVDIAGSYDGAAQAVVEEVLLAGPCEVGISESGRRTLGAVETDLVEGKHIPLSPDDVVVVSGGARGVTAEAALALAQAFKPTLVLLGRSPAPTPEPDWLLGVETESEIKKLILARSGKKMTPKAIGEIYRDIAENREMLRNIARMERAGATVLYRCVDVRDPQAVKAILDDVRESEGPVRGLLHGAGVLADCLIEDKTEEQFDRVFGTKIEGLRALWSAVEGDSLKVLVLFSSTTGRLGRVGQSDYAMANEALNGFAREKSRALPGCRVLSVNWGPWEGGMVTPGLRALFKKEGVGLIPLERGAAYLVDELRAGDGPAETVILGGGMPGASEVPHLEEELLAVFQRGMSLEENPFLRSHVIGGQAVLPMAVILEWLAHGAMHGNPGLVFAGFDDLRILKGVRVGRGDAPAIEVFSGPAVREDGVYRVSTELRGPSDVVHARGTILLADAALKPELPVVEVRAKKFPGPVQRVYSDYLFHGPDLQGIRTILGCAPEGIVSEVGCAPEPSRWLKKPLRSAWIADPLALDCAFQLMIVWSFEKHQAGSLPTFAAHYRQFRPAFPKEGVKIVIRVVKNGKHRALSDIEFLDAEGNLVARLNGYECVVDASLNEAFQRRTLEFPIPKVSA